MAFVHTSKLFLHLRDVLEDNSVNSVSYQKADTLPIQIDMRFYGDTSGMHRHSDGTLTPIKLSENIVITPNIKHVTANKEFVDTVGFSLQYKMLTLTMTAREPEFMLPDLEAVQDILSTEYDGTSKTIGDTEFEFDVFNVSGSGPSTTDSVRPEPYSNPENITLENNYIRRTLFISFWYPQVLRGD